MSLQSSLRVDSQPSDRGQKTGRSVQRMKHLKTVSIENHGNEQDGILDIQIIKNDSATAKSSKKYEQKVLKKANTKTSTLKKPCKKHAKLQFAASEHDSHHSRSHSPAEKAPEITEKELEQLQKNLTKGLTIPNTGSGIIDKEALRFQLAKSNFDMAQNVSKGTFPIFGYPLVCYSPLGGKKSEFWQVMYSSAMKKV